MPNNTNGQAPTAFSFEDFSLQDIYAANGTTLEADIVLDMAGKAKTITMRNGDTIDISPGLKGTLTNNDTGDTFDFVATGSIRNSVNDDGTILATANGLNLIGNPYVDDGAYALTQTRGHFTYTYDDANVPPWGPLEGDGQIIFIVDDLIA